MHIVQLKFVRLLICYFDSCILQITEQIDDINFPQVSG